MKRLQLQTDDLETLKKTYKRAREAYECDKSNKELKRAKHEAKKTLKHAEAAASGAVSPSKVKVDCGVVSSLDQETIEGENEPNVSGNGDSLDITTLEEAYQSALSAFKANKADKDLRRAKTAARRALDKAIAASTDGKQLDCVSCSKKFIFSTEEQRNYDKMGWKEMPKRCGSCKDARAAGQPSSLERRSRLDGKKRNMCYAFQRGECPHGNNCKFSHNPNHGGKRSVAVGKTEGTSGDVSRIEESKNRKERGMRKKGKGWRNK